MFLSNYPDLSVDFLYSGLTFVHGTDTWTIESVVWSNGYQFVPEIPYKTETPWHLTLDSFRVFLRRYNSRGNL